MDFGKMQSLICIDITHASQEGLVQQQRFDLPLFFVQHFEEQTRVEFRVEWFWAQAAQHRLWVSHQPHPPKFPRIIEHQAQSIVEVDPDPVMRLLLAFLETLPSNLRSSANVPAAYHSSAGWIKISLGGQYSLRSGP